MARSNFESGPAFEYETVRLGHYPEKRNKKGSEPEGAEVATFGSDKLIFIGAERASLVGVYKDEGPGKAPTFLQALPGGIGPEGLLAIPARNLFVTASETDLREDGLIGSVVTIYRAQRGTPAYPTILSADDANGLPLALGALSGTVADATGRPASSMPSSTAPIRKARILTIDATQKPALITGAITVTKDGKPAEASRSRRHRDSRRRRLLACLGRQSRARKNKTQSTLIKVGCRGQDRRGDRPSRSARRQATRFGFEGVTVTGSGADETVWLAVQREWKDDPKGMFKSSPTSPPTRAGASSTTRSTRPRKAGSAFPKSPPCQAALS